MNRKITKTGIALWMMVAGSLGGAAPAVAATSDPVADAAARAHLTALYYGADPNSPARFRLIEELDRVAGRPTTGPSEHAQFRQVEDAR